MGYRVEYGPKPKKLGKKPRLGPGTLVMAAGFFLGFVVLTLRCWPGGAQVLRRWLLPEPALEEFARQLSQGVHLTDALETVCREAFSVVPG